MKRYLVIANGKCVGSVDTFAEACRLYWPYSNGYILDTQDGQEMDWGI
jgi:hypothetical protein